MMLIFEHGSMSEEGFLHDDICKQRVFCTLSISHSRGYKFFLAEWDSNNSDVVVKSSQYFCTVPL